MSFIQPGANLQLSIVQWKGHLNGGEMSMIGKYTEGVEGTFPATFYVKRLWKLVSLVLVDDLLFHFRRFFIIIFAR